MLHISCSMDQTFSFGVQRLIDHMILVLEAIDSNVAVAHDKVEMVEQSLE